MDDSITVESAPTSTATPAPYGRACTNCFRAKVKCLNRTAGLAGCVRCYRLSKDCQPTVPVRKRNAKKPRSRAAQIEEKLDGLVSLLQSQSQTQAQTPHGELQNQPGHPGATDAEFNNLSNIHKTAPSGGVIPIITSTAAASSSCGGSTPTHHGSASDLSTLGLSSSAQSRSNFQNLAGVYYQSFPPGTSPEAAPSPNNATLGGEISPGEAEEYLVQFRVRMLPLFPFLYIHPDTSARMLQQELPVLWKCVMWLGTSSMPRKARLGSEIRQRLTHSILVAEEASLDLLLASLCFIAWGQHLRKDDSYISIWAQVAISSVFILGLNKPPPEGRERTKVEQRAVLGVFTISSIVSTFSQQMDALRWTPHLDSCLRNLVEHPEWTGDKILVAQVRLNIVTANINHAPWYKGEYRSSYIFPTAYLKALRAQVQDAERSLSSDVQQNKVVLLFLHITDLLVNEVAPTHPLTTAAGTTDLQRLDCLERSLGAASSWCRVFFSLPRRSLMEIPRAIYWQLEHVMTSLFQLTMLDDPAWDRDAVRRTADVFEMLERLAAGLESLPVQRLGMDPDPDDDLALGTARCLREMKGNWEAEFAAAQEQRERQGVHETMQYGGANVQAGGPYGSPAMCHVLACVGAQEGGMLAVPAAAAAVQVYGPAEDDGGANYLSDSWLADMFAGPWAPSSYSGDN